MGRKKPQRSEDFSRMERGEEALFMILLLGTIGTLSITLAVAIPLAVAVETN